MNGAPFFCRTARAVPVDRCPDKCNHGMADAHRLHDTTTVTYAVHKHNMSEYNRKRRQLVNKPSIEYVFTFVQIVQLLKLPCGERGDRHCMCQTASDGHVFTNSQDFSIFHLPPPTFDFLPILTCEYQNFPFYPSNVNNPAKEPLRSTTL